MYKVLLVDDESLFTDYLSHLLVWEEWGCTLCGTASDGETAWKMILRHRPDVLFLDINIPPPDGLELCRRLREEKIPCEVIVVSAHSDFAFTKKAIRYDVVDYLLKPFDREELIQALTSCLGRVADGRARLLRRCLQGQDTLPVPCVMAVMHTGEQPGAAFLTRVCGEFEKQAGSCWGVLDGRDYLFACEAKNGVEPLQHFFSDFAGPDTVTALGDVAGSLGESLRHARTAMENRTLAKGGVICYEELTPVSGTMFSQADMGRLVGCLENRDYAGASEWVARLFGLGNTSGISFQYFLSVFSSLALFMAHHYGKSRADAEKMLAQQASIVRELSAATHVDDLTAVIENAVYELYSDCAPMAPPTRRSELVDKINRYIETHYMQQKLTVEKMAADLLFENSYIRRVYKAACGITILRALENYRIERAKEMLARHTMRHSEIAAATGFSDPYYFSKRFKQIVGCTPTEYEGMMYHE